MIQMGQQYLPISVPLFWSGFCNSEDSNCNFENIRLIVYEVDILERLEGSGKEPTSFKLLKSHNPVKEYYSGVVIKNIE